MHYQSMQSQAREKHAQLRREAQLHRLARQNGNQQKMSQRLAVVARSADALADSVATSSKSVLARLELVGRSAGRFISEKASAVL